MNKPMKMLAILVTVVATFSLSQLDTAEAQVVTAYYPPAAVAVVPARPRLLPRCTTYRPVVPVQVGYPAFYAPQVPVVPMSPVPVPTMSAYYMPTAPVVPAYVEPVYSTRRVPYYPAPVLPAVVYPVYGY
ncbi:MAG: hypothetical protein MK108_00585 [Mariniblastus sp.]|nr:hypothetical protein [Mariniblastus sp.]